MNLTAAPVRILPRHQMPVAELQRLDDLLFDHNRRTIGHDDGDGLAFVAVDDNGVQVGAIAGYTWANMAEIKQLWVAEACRGRGLGRQLLEAAIAESMARELQGIWVLSHNFQAPGLYEKCGFSRVTELRDWPPGHSLVVLHRQLPAVADNAC